MSRIRLAAAFVLVVMPWTLLAQSAAEKHVSVGVANFVAPAVTVGVDAIRPSGFSLGGSASLVTTGRWALYGASFTAGIYGLGYSRNRPFVLAEIGYFNETDCCGTSALVGFGGGVTRWLSRGAALRIEGRLLLPLHGDGGLIVVQIGRSFR